MTKTCKYLLHLGGTLFEVLRLWLDAKECKQDITLFWKPPLERPFHRFGQESIMLKKALAVINMYEQELFTSTLVDLEGGTYDGKNSTVNFKFVSDSEDSDDPEMEGYRSKKLDISIKNDETKETETKVIKYPRWERRDTKLLPAECQGCRDHLECVRKRVMESGYTLPLVFEVHYEPNFHVKIMDGYLAQASLCRLCNTRLAAGEEACSVRTAEQERAPSSSGARKKDVKLSRRQVKQMQKKERRKKRREKAASEATSQDKLEAEGMKIFVEGKYTRMNVQWNLVITRSLGP